MALGAFLAGLVVGRSEYALRAASEALPLRDAFAVLFFVSVGMLLQPASLLEQRWLVLGTLAVILIGKPLVAFFITWLLRYPLLTSLSMLRFRPLGAMPGGSVPNGVVAGGWPLSSLFW